MDFFFEYVFLCIVLRGIIDEFLLMIIVGYDLLLLCLEIYYNYSEI